jgi:arabinose-5-phosphate isomerase
MAVMKAKGIQPDDFAVNHPGGKLGRRLLLSVRDVMVPKEKCPILNPDTASMEDILLALGQFSLGVVLLSRDGSNLAGILTDGDVRRLLSNHRLDFFKLSVTKEMNPQPIHISAETSAFQALETMESRPKPLNLLVATSGTSTGAAPSASKAIAGVVRLHDLVGVR